MKYIILIEGKTLLIMTSSSMGYEGKALLIMTSRSMGYEVYYIDRG